MQIENSNVQVTSESMAIGNIVLSEDNFRPMLFSTLMVQSLLNGTKTQTRRIIKEQYKWDDFRILTNSKGIFLRICEVEHNSHSNKYMERDAKKLTINIGDIIWVRETYFDTSNVPKAELFKDVGKYIYKADNAYIGSQNWKPSLFMTKEACRLWLKVANVRVQRLQDITEDDAKKEGLLTEELMSEAFRNHFGYSVGYKNYLSKHTDFVRCPIESYKSLWEYINGKGSWDANPFVWVFDFEIIREAPFGFR